MHLPRYSIRKLAYFAVAAEAGTVTAAAQALNITQSALSDALSSLENEVGIQLLHRRKARGVELTDAGNTILRLTRDILSQFEEFEFALENLENRIQGEITIGCYTTLSPLVIPRLLDRMRERYPDIQLNFIEADQDELQVMLSDSKIEAAFAYNVDIDKSVSFHKLTASKPYILISPRHRLANESSIDLQDIVDDNLITIDLSPSLVNTEHFFHLQGLQPNIWQKTKSIELARSLVGFNLGYTLLMHRARGRSTSLEGNPILVKDIRHELPPSEIGLIFKPGKTASRKLAIIRDVTDSLYPPS